MTANKSKNSSANEFPFVYRITDFFFNSVFLLRDQDEKKNIIGKASSEKKGDKEDKDYKADDTSDSSATNLNKEHDSSNGVVAIEKTNNKKERANNEFIQTVEPWHVIGVNDLIVEYAGVRELALLSFCQARDQLAAIWLEQEAEKDQKEAEEDALQKNNQKVNYKENHKGDFLQKKNKVNKEEINFKIPEQKNNQVFELNTNPAHQNAKAVSFLDEASAILRVAKKQNVNAYLPKEIKFQHKTQDFDKTLEELQKTFEDNIQKASDEVEQEESTGKITNRDLFYQKYQKGLDKAFGRAYLKLLADFSLLSSLILERNFFEDSIGLVIGKKVSDLTGEVERSFYHALRLFIYCQENVLLDVLFYLTKQFKEEIFRDIKKETKDQLREFYKNLPLYEKLAYAKIAKNIDRRDIFIESSKANKSIDNVNKKEDFEKAQSLDAFSGAKEDQEMREVKKCESHKNSEFVNRSENFYNISVCIKKNNIDINNDDIKYYLLFLKLITPQEAFFLSSSSSKNGEHSKQNLKLYLISLLPKAVELRAPGLLEELLVLTEGGDRLILTSNIDSVFENSNKFSNTGIAHLEYLGCLRILLRKLWNINEKMDFYQGVVDHFSKSCKNYLNDKRKKSIIFIDFLRLSYLEDTALFAKVLSGNEVRVFFQNPKVQGTLATLLFKFFNSHSFEDFSPYETFPEVGEIAFELPKKTRFLAKFFFKRTPSNTFLQNEHDLSFSDRDDIGGQKEIFIKEEKTLKNKEIKNPKDEPLGYKLLKSYIKTLNNEKPATLEIIENEYKFSEWYNYDKKEKSFKNKHIEILILIASLGETKETEDVFDFLFTQEKFKIGLLKDKKSMWFIADLIRKRHYGERIISLQYNSQLIKAASQFEDNFLVEHLLSRLEVLAHLPLVEIVWYESGVLNLFVDKKREFPRFTLFYYASEFLSNFSQACAAFSHDSGNKSRGNVLDKIKKVSSIERWKKKRYIHAWLAAILSLFGLVVGSSLLVFYGLLTLKMALQACLSLFFLNALLSIGLWCLGLITNVADFFGATIAGFSITFLLKQAIIDSLFKVVPSELDFPSVFSFASIMFVIAAILISLLTLSFDFFFYAPLVAIFASTSLWSFPILAVIPFFSTVGWLYYNLSEFFEYRALKREVAEIRAESLIILQQPENEDPQTETLLLSQQSEDEKLQIKAPTVFREQKESFNPENIKEEDKKPDSQSNFANNQQSQRSQHSQYFAVNNPNAFYNSPVTKNSNSFEAKNEEAFSEDPSADFSIR